jgi:threonine dehydrogenase-like Zn-dependent dehydrogenase
MTNEKMLAWQLFGAGMENFGENEAPSVINIPDYNDDEILMKVVAIGLCFSDCKLIKAGESHPRVIVDDLKKTPIIPGHEAVLEIVGIGKNISDKFKEGQRFIIQADLFKDGVGLAYGYAINGGMAQYSVMTEPVLNGDDGCYLLPVSDKISAAEAALIEPWTCVIAAYRIKFRDGLKPGGILRVVGDGQPADFTIANLLNEKNAPSRIIVSDLTGNLLDELNSFAEKNNISVENFSECSESADDFILTGKHEVEEIEKYAVQLTQNGIFCLAGDYSDLDAQLDVGNIHYAYWRYVGTTSKDLNAAYKTNTRQTFQSGGTAWFPGGAGAMGQMHVQLALEMESGPKKVVVSDLDDVRLVQLKKRLQEKADKNNVEFVTYNPKNFADEAAFMEKLREESEGGFDDIIMLVPVPFVVSSAVKLLGENGLMNVFAGIPVGNCATFNIGAIASKGQRFIASSGSGMDDIKYTLQLTEDGKLSPVYALAAIGGMNVLKEGMEGVFSARFPGKTVIYPHAVELPLIAVSEVGTVCEDGAETLVNGEILTQATEDCVRGKWES